MRIGLVEFLLILAIASVTVGPRVMLFVDRWMRRAQRTSRAAARRRAEYEAQMAAERDALLKRFRVVTSAFGVVILLVLGYGLLLRPLDTPPQAYIAPAVRQTAQKTVAAEQQLDLGTYSEVSCLRQKDGWLYAAVRADKKTAAILRVREDGSGQTALLTQPGEITSFDFDAQGNIWFTAVTAEGGALYRASYDGWGAAAQQIVGQINGKALDCPMAVAVGQDGRVYFTDAAAVSTEDGTLAALRRELLAHTATGWVYVYDPETLAVRQVLGGLAGADGLAISPDGKTLYVSDLGSRCVWAVSADAQGLTAGGRDCGVLAQELPGYPGALAVDGEGTVYISYRWAQSSWLENSAENTFLRGVALRAGTSVQARLLDLPQGKPAAEAVDAEGAVRYGLTGTRAGSCTAVCPVDNRVYLAFSGQNMLRWART